MALTSVSIAAALGFVLGAAVAVCVFGYLVSRAEKIRMRAAAETSGALISALSTALLKNATHPSTPKE